MKGYLHNYGILGFMRLIIHKVMTLFLFKDVRLIRFPIYLRGRNKIKFGKGLTTGVGVRLDALGDGSGVKIEFGTDVQLNDYVHIGAIEKVKIGNNVLIASRVFISDHNHGNYSGERSHCSPDQLPIDRDLVASPVIIEDRVWIGENVCVLPGVKIGAGAIVGAGSIVTRDVEPETIVVGNPARVIKRFNRTSSTWQVIN